MYPLKVSLKYFLVFMLALGGFLSLSRGFGLPIPFLEYGAAETWNVLLGAGLLAFAACIAVFWHVGKPQTKKPLSRGRMRDDWLLDGSTTIPRKF
jgi:hypothetical protein